MKYIYILPLLIIGVFQGCKQNSKTQFGNSIATNVKKIENGQHLFTLHCSSCHNFNKKGIGPNLNGLTRKVKTDWIKEFVNDPGEMIAKKDSRALLKYGHFCSIPKK